MNINDRIRKLLNSCQFTTEEIAEKTGFKYGRWTTIRKKDGQARAEEVEALCILFPEFTMWISAGKVYPEIGQISPELEETSISYGKTGTDTE